MRRLALASVRSRLGAFGACALAIFLGTAVMGGFASLIETSGAAGVSDADAETLVTMATVVGLWGCVIVLFAVSSTVAVTVRQRSAEIALLREVGATRRQVNRLIRVETVAVAVVAALAGLVPAALTGRLLLDLLGRAGLVSPDLGHVFGVATGAALVGVMVVVAWLAAGLAARQARRERTVDRERLGLGRTTAAVLLVAGAISLGVLTVAVGGPSDDPFTAMQFAGPASIAASAGLGLLGPALVRRGGTALRRWPGRPGVVELAAATLQRRPRQLGAALLPIVIFVGLTVGTVNLMAIHSATEIDTAAVPDGEAVELLNYVVVAMIAVFAAIMVVNILVATILDRRRELICLRLVGSSPAQRRRALLLEAIVLTTAGSVLGCLGASATIVPFAVVHDASGMLWWTVPATLAVAFVLTLGTVSVAARRAGRTALVLAA